jgi:predicted RNA-binding Zn-ribbon protein involved in translation (DUF1610 family)
MEIKEYKCPNCGGAVKFDSYTQNLKCPFCDAEFGITALEDYQKELAAAAEDNFGWEVQKAGKAWEEEELDDLAQGSCPSCGAELIGDKNTAAMVCPCCGNAQIVQRRLTGVLKPDYVIPFKLDKKIAVEALKNFYQGKRLLPDLFKEENRINGIQGLYVPFWLFDARAQGKIRYRASRTKFWSDSNYNYTKTDFYSVIREGIIDFEKVPVDGSEKMDDNYMDAIEPFNYTLIKDFQSAFLAGYSAEKYDVDAEKSRERAGRRVKASVEEEFARSVTGYASVRPESSVVNIENGKVSYAMLPVWILNTRYHKENYQFIMNGESGRLVGSLPADPAKVWKYRLLFTGIIGAASTILIQILRIFM